MSEDCWLAEALRKEADEECESVIRGLGVEVHVLIMIGKPSTEKRIANEASRYSWEGL